MTRAKDEQPNNVEAEQAFLGSALLDPAAAFRIDPPVRPADFYIERHSYLWQAMLDMKRKRVAIDTVTLSDYLRGRDWLDLIGGVPYLARLVRRTPTAVHVHHYAQLVRRYAKLRRVIAIAGRLARQAYVVKDLEETLAQLEKIVIDLLQYLRDVPNLSFKEEFMEPHKTPKLRIIGQRPENVPESWAIYNAARPLEGNLTWEGDWFNGPHYAAVNPADIDESWMAKTNLEDRLATEIEYVDEETAINEQIAYYEGLMPEVAEQAKTGRAETETRQKILAGWCNRQRIIFQRSSRTVRQPV